jgi:hypothetical protein
MEIIGFKILKAKLFFDVKEYLNGGCGKFMDLCVIWNLSG